MEQASRRGRRHTAKDVRDIPAFRDHLAREGIDFETWKKRQCLAADTNDATSESLSLQAQRARLRH